MSPRRPAWPMAAVALLVLAGCGNATSGSAGPAATATDRHTLTVHTEIAPGKGGEMFTEGAVPEVRLVAKEGSALHPVRDHADPAVFRDLPPGSYRLTANLRPCDGNCGYLDAPTGPCHTVVQIPRDTMVRVSWRVGQKCHVT